MASHGTSTSPAAKLLAQTLSIPLPPRDSTTADDSDKWEYEYSATETETYYLTLDFTSPLIPTYRSRRSQAGRGGYRRKWVNPGLGRQKRQLGRPPVISLPKVDPTYAFSQPAVEEDEEGEEEPDAEVEAESPDPINTGAELIEENEQVPGFTDGPEEIQILELHSENPMISYKGHTFSCNWAENIGTELLFTAHDPKNLLPTLRSLPDNVDLLAASSARLNSTPVRLSPKPEAQNNTIRWDSDSDCELYSGLGTDKPELVIPIGREASKSRKEQAEFLEKMVDLKQRKGEGDAVTIIATKRLTNNAWHGQIKHKKDEERAGLKQIIRRGGPAVVEAKQRLDELRREEAVRVKNEQARKRILNERERDKSSKRARAGMVRKPRGGLDKFMELQSHAEATIPTLGRAQIALSTPTPRSWDDLQRESYEPRGAADDMD